MMDVTGVPEQCYRYCEAAELLSEFREKTNNSSTNIRDINIIDIKVQTCILNSGVKNMAMSIAVNDMPLIVKTRVSKG